MKVCLTWAKMQIQMPAKSSGIALTNARRESSSTDKRIHASGDEAADKAPSGSALASMCQFLAGFASYGGACAGALIVLETPH